MTLANAPCIIATVARCAVGLTAESAGAAIRAGISMVGEHEIFTDATRAPVLCAREPTLLAGQSAAERMASLAIAGLADMISSLETAGALPKELIVILALPEPRPRVNAANVTTITEALSATSPGVSVKVRAAAMGHAGALLAIREAASLLTSGRTPLVLVGGVDSYLDAETLAWLDADFRLARAKVRNGFPPGEGVAFLALATSDHCRNLRLPVLARIVGMGFANETRDPKSETGLLGEALGAAIVEATAFIVADGMIVTDTVGDINGELARTLDWGFALLRHSVRFRDGTDYVSFSGECGDLGAATGAFGCALAIENWRYEIANGRDTLIWAGSWGGLRGAVVLRAEEG